MVDAPRAVVETKRIRKNRIPILLARVWLQQLLAEVALSSEFVFPNLIFGISFLKGICNICNICKI
jgi:hypothetical protein